MKKTISLILAAVMMLSAAMLLVGCGENKEPAADEEKTEKVKAALIVSGTFGDKGIFDSAKAGLDRLDEDGYIDAKTIQCDGQNFAQQLRNAADECGIVMPVGQEFGDELAAVAEEYPDVKFIWCDGELEKAPENVLCISYAEDEGAFLTGFIAAKMSKSGVIGAVGGQDGGSFAAYKQGAQHANKDIKVVTNYISASDSEDQGKARAVSLNNKGADVIFQAAGSAGKGVFDAAKENGFLAIGSDTDQKWIDEDVVICSLVKKIEDAIYDTVKAYAESGKLEDGVKKADVSSGYIEIGYGENGTNQQMEADLKNEVEKLKKEIADGKIKVEPAKN